MAKRPKPFEHLPSFLANDDSGSFQPAFFEAEYERLYAEALDDGPIGPEERGRLDLAAGALGLSRDRIERIEDGLRRALEARASITVLDSLENMATDHGMYAWDDLIDEPAPRSDGPGNAATLEIAAIPDADVLDYVSQAPHVPDAQAPPEASFPEIHFEYESRPPQPTVSEDERATPPAFRAAPPSTPAEQAEAELHERFASARERGLVDEQFTLASVLVRRQAATPEQGDLYAKMRTGTLPRPERSLTATGWTARLIDPAQDRTTSEIFGVIASAALFARVSAMRLDGVLPRLDPARREDPATTTVSAVRALGWSAATLGMIVPPTYLAPDSDTGLEIIPAVPPATRIGAMLLSGRHALELAFRCGRHMTWLREEYFICTLMPSIRQLQDVFLAALLIGDPALALDRVSRDRASVTRDVLLPILEDQRVLRLGELSEDFRRKGGRTSLRDWRRTADQTACRAGLLVCGNLEVACEVLLREPHGDERITELEDFWASPAANELRRDLGIALD